MNNKILSIKAIANGNFGPIFAVGAVLIDTKTGVVFDKFQAKCDIAGQPSPFVAEHVLPVIGQLTLHRSAEAVRSAFWLWFAQRRSGADILVDRGYPIEARLFEACQRDFLSVRANDGPRPLHELSSILMCAGVDPDMGRVHYASNLLGRRVVQHNPVDDAYTSAICAVKALRTIVMERTK